jgi:gamma-glutamyltranspeptidase/glutathione hydrolase
MSFGVMGGDFQPQGYKSLNMIDFGMNLQELEILLDLSISSSSVTGELALGQGEILMESGFDFEEIRKLMNKGHKGFGGYWRISSYNVRCNKKSVLVHLNRKDGQASGY